MSEQGMPRPFVLQRAEDVSGVSGTGIVASGVEFPDGTAVLRWHSQWPTSVVFHERGMEGIEAVHGHDGRTKVVWLDGGDMFSGVTVTDSSGTHRLTWRERFEREQQDKWDQQKWGVLVSDLDRCEHGRHEGDVCSSCGGPSVGNPVLPSGAVVGHTLDAVPIVVPPRERRHEVDAWTVR